MRKLVEVTEVNEHGYIAYKFEDSKRSACAKVKEDEEGVYFISNKVKYYVSTKPNNVELARKKWEALDKYRAEMMPSLIVATEREIIDLLGYDPTK